MEQAVLEEEQLDVPDVSGGAEVEEDANDVAVSHDEVEISLGEESLTSEDSEDNSAPAWVKELRKSHRETQKKNRELEQRLKEAEGKAIQEQAPQVKTKPTLESFEYDSEKYEAALGEWYDNKKKLDEVEKRKQAEIEDKQSNYQKRLVEYENGKKELGVKDYDDAETVAIEHLSLDQQQLLLQATDNPALTVYAIGKNEKRAKDLAAIKDPIKFVSAVAKLEGQLKVSKRKAQTDPETPLVSSGKKSASDSTLKRLEAEADKTGDRTKVAAYKRQMKLKSKQ